MSLGVELDRAGVVLGGQQVLQDLTFTVSEGRFACVIGASGSGKSTILNLVSGLLAPSQGAVRVGGQAVSGVNPRVQLVFQNGAIFPWLTVAENVAFGLQAARVPDRIRAGEVEGYLRLVGLERVASRRVHELSGGMAQRVAIARALVLQPQVLLLDEPFSALDAITRSNLHVELLRLWAETKVTIIFVTHNLREALLLGDDIHLLGSRPGRLERSWTVDIPRPEREHHPSLRPMEAELRHRLEVAHPDFDPTEDGSGRAVS